MKYMPMIYSLQYVPGILAMRIPLDYLTLATISSTRMEPMRLTLCSSAHLINGKCLVPITLAIITNFYYRISIVLNPKQEFN